MESRLFTPNDRISPGFYMEYWRRLGTKYGEAGLNSGKLKAYREVRNGAILAALWTKTSGRKHFVSFPQDEPSDVEIYSLPPTTHNGKPSYHLAKIPVQLTRCLSSAGETVAGQVRKKNKPALSTTSLVVHMIGEDGVPFDINKVVTEVRQIGKLFPKEIAVLAPLEDKEKPGEQTFGQFLIHHRKDSGVRMSKVHTGESAAFFMDPRVMLSERGTGQGIEQAGQINLRMP